MSCSTNFQFLICKYMEMNSELKGMKKLTPHDFFICNSKQNLVILTA